jgi:iron only hydrogenase large subunit-like protein
MNPISLFEANCKSCHHCVRACVTKSIAFVNGKPEIDEDECILCGACYTVCPHDAKQITSDLSQVRQWILSGEEVIASLAPSYPVLNADFSKWKQRLLEVGFSDVVETAQGAAYVSAEYVRLASEHPDQTFISTCCPAVVTFVETRYPDLVRLLAPTLSPMVVSAKLIKEKHPDAKVVFISPCIAKIKEASQHRRWVDGVVTMSELETMMRIRDDRYPPTNTEIYQGRITRSYPSTTGILKSIRPFLSDDVDLMCVEGIDRVKEVLEALRNQTLPGTFIEMSACVGSCLNGPILRPYKNREISAINAIHATREKDTLPINQQLVETIYTPNPLIVKTYSEYDIRTVMAKLGKTDPSKELNCGACGYPTCHEKAIAVLDKKADPFLCLPFALEKAQSMSNAVIEHTPNGIIIVDEEAVIVEINPAARDLLDCVNFPVKGFPLEALLPDPKLKPLVLDTSKVNYLQSDYPQYGRTFMHATVPLSEEHCTLIILMDLTQEKNRERQLKQVRSDTLVVTQQVLDEQMRTVQEIAKLLGETTAKSKIALSRLKKSVEEDK